MAQAAVLEISSLNASLTMKRKTPSELRGEQLKRRSGQMLAHEKLAPSLASDSDNGGLMDGLKKVEPLKIPKYINSRVDEVYQIRKSSERCRVLYGNEKSKHSVTAGGASVDLVDPSSATTIAVKAKFSFPCGKVETPKTSECLDTVVKDIANHGFHKIKNCSQSVLRNVAEVHLGCEKSDFVKVDMEKALKGLVARDILGASPPLVDSLGKFGDLPSIAPRNLCCEFHIPGHKAPLDFTLKTSLRLVSSSSVKWCHRLSASPANIGMCWCPSQFCSNKDPNLVCSPGLSQTADYLYSKALHSWAYPQSSLPPSIISAMALSTVRGEIDFLSKRKEDWEDSFRNLYYMLRQNICNIFYVYTSQFVVLFIGGKFSGKKCSCNAYLSQSTHGLRSLLRKHDIHFSMPLCCAEVEQATKDDLDELSEIEKRNLGQTFHLDSLSDVDNSPQSLLSFIGNEDVHGLYDFLLNYRFYLNSLSVVDVPVLYSPVPFQNASLCIPEVRYKEMKRADLVLTSSLGSDTEDTDNSPALSAGGICYSFEIKDTILPPWIVCRVCAAMSSDGQSFESIYTTDPISNGLNVALDSVCPDGNIPMEANNIFPKAGDTFGIPEAVLSSCMRSASLRRLKYANGSHVVEVSPV